MASLTPVAKAKTQSKPAEEFASLARSVKKQRRTIFRTNEKTLLMKNGLPLWKRMSEDYADQMFSATPNIDRLQMDPESAFGGFSPRDGLIFINKFEQLVDAWRRSFAPHESLLQFSYNLQHALCKPYISRLFADSTYLACEDFMAECLQMSVRMAGVVAREEQLKTEAAQHPVLEEIEAQGTHTNEPPVDIHTDMLLSESSSEEHALDMFKL